MRKLSTTLLFVLPLIWVSKANAIDNPATLVPTDILLTGVIDGPLSGGVPKAIELYVVNDIPDLSIYGVGSANNGGGSDGEEFTFPAVAATAGQFIYVASESTGFTSFFGFAPDYVSGAASINGDDAIELFENGVVIDTFGDIGMDGTNQPWEYLDGWAYRVDMTDADGMTYTPSDWFFSGRNALDGETTNAGATTPFPIGTYVPLGGGVDVPPVVSNTIPADMAVDVSLTSNIVVNFSEDVNVMGSWFSIVCTTSGAHPATVTGTSPTASYTLDPTVDFVNSETCTLTVTASLIEDLDAPVDNMAMDYMMSFTTLAPTAVVEIFEIQGSGSASPYDTQIVTAEDNIVTAVGTDRFAMQTPDARDDGDPTTSNGIIVFTGSAPTVSVGDQVDVTGEIEEFFELTEFTDSPSVSIDNSGNPLPTVTVFNATDPSPSAPGNLEQYEGMYVSVTNAFVTSPTDQFGDAVLSMNGRAFREPGVEFPEVGPVVWDSNPELFELDPDELGLPNLDINGESTVTGEGVIGFSFGDYVLWPSSLTVTSANPAGAVRAQTSSEATVGSLNVLRLFDDVDDGNGGPTTDPQVYQDRLNKFSLYIRTLMQSPDILAIQEIENINTLQDLAAKILADDANVVYTAHLVEGNDQGGIDVGFLTRATVSGITISQLGATETYLNPINNQQEILHDRPPLLLEGTITAGAAPISVLNLHQRSLGGITGNEAQRVKVKRSEQAKSVAVMAQARQADNLVITGDFNAFQFSDGYADVLGQITGTPDPNGAEIPVTPIVSPAMINQVSTVPAAEQYSFIFGGSSQVLDHFITNASIPTAPPFQRAPLLAGELEFNEMQFARGNVDAFRANDADPNTPLRSSDHDGLVGYLVLSTPLPVDLVSFEASVEEGDVNLHWSTASEENNAGFEIEYSEVIGKSAESIWTALGFVEGNGSSIESHEYSYRVQDLDPGSYNFRLKQVDFDGSFEYSETVLASLDIPGEFVLRPAYPNPFNPTTTIRFAVAERQKVQLKLFNGMGELISVAYDGEPTANTMQSVLVDASGLASGNYFVRIEGSTFVANQKILLIK